MIAGDLWERSVLAFQRGFRREVASSSSSSLLLLLLLWMTILDFLESPDICLLPPVRPLRWEESTQHTTYTEGIC